ncbi:MAG: T9SS type A sorting domain-containing protein [Lutibacter sp.]|nr:T9SS type A sorting domain-containing protein [Lutibacter sp.]
MKQNYFLFFVLYFICTTLGFSQIVNEGILQIKVSTNVYFGDEYTNKSSAEHKNDGELYLNHNFINNGITTSVSGTTFFTSSVNAIQTISGSTKSVNFYNLEVDKLSTGVSVEDLFELNVANAVTLTKGDLRLVGESQLLQTHEGVSANLGSGKLLRDQQGISSKYGYNYWSSPVTTTASPKSFKLNEGLYDGTDVVANPFTPTLILYTTGLDGSSLTTPKTISERWLYTYSPNNSGYAGWVKIYRNSEINPGEGFTMKGTGAENQNYVFKGLPNDGDYRFTITNGQSALLGNPYPSALDSRKFINDNPSVNQLEIWIDGGSDTHYLADYEGGYGVLNNTGGVAASVPAGILGLGTSSGITPKRYLAVAQGFFVTAIASNDIIFNNSQRIFKSESIPSDASNFYKTSEIKNIVQKKITDNERFIRIGYEDPKKFHRQLLLGFMPDSPADLNYNRGYDALMSGPREDELFFIIEKDVTKKYVIQGVNAFDETYEFDLGLIITEEGEHTIMLDAVENFTGKVYIKDVLANITYNLSEGNFKPMLPPGKYLDRFKLVFKDKTASVVAEDLVSAINAFPEKTTVYYHKNESLIVRTKSDLQVNNISIYNILGQQIKQVLGNELGKNVFAIPFHYPLGVYLVIVQSELGKETFKIINK